MADQRRPTIPTDPVARLAMANSAWLQFKQAEATVHRLEFCKNLTAAMKADKFAAMQRVVDAQTTLTACLRPVNVEELSCG